MPNATNLDRGQTLLEVLMVAGVLSLLLTGLVSLVVTSTARTTLSQRRTAANRLVQEGIEWARAQRKEHGWLLFTDQVDNKQYCLADPNITIYTTTGPCDVSDSSDLIADVYWRTVSFEVGPDTVEVKISVDWLGNNRNPLESMTTFHKRYEE